MVGDLFVSRSLEVESAEHGNVEYTKQLLLSCLLNVCQKISPDGKPVSAGTNTAYLCLCYLRTYYV